MNQGMFMQIRDYLTSIDSRLGQLITEQKRTNELLAAQGGDVFYPKLNIVREAPPAGTDKPEVAIERIPWAGYDSMTIAEIMEHLGGTAFNDDGWAQVREYEKAHKNRRGVLDALGSRGE